MFLIPEESKPSICVNLDVQSSRLIHLQVIAGGKVKWPNFLHNIMNTNTNVWESASEKKIKVEVNRQFHESETAFD